MDVNKIKKDFPMFDTHPDLSYLDTTAMALRPISVINKMTEYYSNYGVNIHRGVYKLSYQATAEYDDARQVVAKFLNAEENEIIFTRNTTESLNQVCLMYSKFLEKGDEIIVTELEHHSSLLPWQNLSKEKNLQLTYMPLNQEGRITVENFKKTISKNTKVLAITYISNVMGFITPLEEIIKLAHEHGIVVVVDAAQAVGHEQVDVKKLDCDFLAFSGHKMMGPTGIGVLFGKYKLLKKLTPVYYGGDMNENVSKFDLEIKEVPFRFEAGTPMIAEAIGLKEAINYIYEIGYDNINKYEKEIREYLFEKLKKISGITVYNPGSDIPLVTFNINGVHPHDAATLFDEQGICIRAGYHCAQLVSQWLGCEGSLRASFYIYNNKADVDKFVETIKTSVEFFSQFTGCTNE